MKYWAYLAAKLAAAGALIWLMGAGIYFWFPKPLIPFTSVPDPFVHDLPYTTAMMVYWLLSIGLVYLAIWDQRYRCRTCLRRLRMPITTGSWTNMLLIGRPKIEYICLYGHGTLSVSELQITGTEKPDWQPHEDIWTELESLGEHKR